MLFEFWIKLVCHNHYQASSPDYHSIIIIIIIIQNDDHRHLNDKWICVCVSVWDTFVIIRNWFDPKWATDRKKIETNGI